MRQLFLIILFNQLTDIIGIDFSDDLCAAVIGRVNAVGGNLLPILVADMRCKQSVKRNKNIGIFTGELPCNLNLRVKVLTEIELVLGRKQELLHHNDFCICLCLDRFKNRAISFFQTRRCRATLSYRLCAMCR